MKLKEQFKSGLFSDNPVFIQLLGMCPTLATSTSLINAIGMGLSATFVLVCSNVLISLLRKFIPEKIRIAAYIVIIAGFVTLVDMLLEAYFNSIYNALGVFIPLIVVNCIILARAESFASKNKVIPSFFDGIFMGLGFTFALSILGSIREILGAGTILGIKLFNGVAPLSIFATPAGGFLTLGFVIAAVQFIAKRAQKEVESND
jgi:electron transport complex protein RnfE